MRVVLIGVSHWHTKFYSEPVLEMTDAAIVGVHDPDPARAAPLAEQANCKVFSDYQEMCAKLKPDFAFVLGRHCDMADYARFLIDNRIPFAIEKPCAVNAAEAHDIARRAAAAGVFAAVPLVFRHCPIIDTVREFARDEAIQYLSFKFVGGMVDRYYQQNVEWVINKKTSGGGPILKINANQRYATDGLGAAEWARACDAAGVEYQEFVSNNSVPCGSTIGPLTATRLGIRTFDVGIPLLSMHSARELAGASDPENLRKAISAFLAG